MQSTKKTRRLKRDEILPRIKEVLEDLDGFDGRPIATDRAVPHALSEEEQGDLCIEFRRLHREIGRAIRSGVRGHPIIETWIQNRRALGQRNLLRSLRPGLERGVRSPLRTLPKNPRQRAAVKALEAQLRELRERKPGLSLRSAYSYLNRNGRVTMSWQGFHKKVHRYHLWPDGGKEHAVEDALVSDAIYNRTVSVFLRNGMSEQEAREAAERAILETVAAFKSVDGFVEQVRKLRRRPRVLATKS